MSYKSIENLNRTIVRNIYKIPDKIELIVYYSHGGLIVATILALHLHKPITNIMYLKEGKIMSSGNRMKKYDNNIKDYKNLLIINDIMNNDSDIIKIKNKIKNICPKKNLIFATVYSNQDSIEKTDIYFESCTTPHFYEWSIFDHPEMENFCVDIDGVLCYDPLPLENDDGEKYLKFIENAPPLVRIRKKIGSLVTNRLEKYRTATEKWLKNNGIVYDELIMQKMPNKQARKEANNYGKFKGNIYKNKNKSTMFIESSLNQAREIADISGKMVYCVDKRTMIYPNQYTPNKIGKKNNTMRKCSRHIRRIGKIWKISKDIVRVTK